MSKCLKCGTEGAYQGLFAHSVECANPQCEHYAAQPMEAIEGSPGDFFVVDEAEARGLLKPSKAREAHVRVCLACKSRVVTDGGVACAQCITTAFCSRCCVE